MAIVRESVLPWYKGERREKGKTSTLECTQSNEDLYQGNTLLLTIAIIFLVDFLTECKMTSCPSILAWCSDGKKTQTYTALTIWKPNQYKGIEDDSHFGQFFNGRLFEFRMAFNIGTTFHHPKSECVRFEPPTIYCRFSRNRQPGGHAPAFQAGSPTKGQG